MWIRNLFDYLKPARSRTPVHKARREEPRRRPAVCRLAIEALEDRSVPASLSVTDVTVIEGPAGVQNAAVTVRLSAPSTKTVTVNYNTANGTALAGSDYNAVSGKLTFARGETSKSIPVTVIGDRIAEPDETFFVKLSGARNAKIVDAYATGVVTIIDDEPRIMIGGVATYQADSGTTPFTFTVSLSAAYDQVVTVNYATIDGTAVAGVDYAAATGTLTFAPGETTRAITVWVLGDVTAGAENKTFFVNLSGASPNALVIGRLGEGIILDSSYVSGQWDYAYAAYYDFSGYYNG